MKKREKVGEVLVTAVKGAVITDSGEFLSFLDEVMEVVRQYTCYPGDFFSDILNSEIFIRVVHNESEAVRELQRDPVLDPFFEDLVSAIDEKPGLGLGG
jgi:hypothetical protein